MLTSSALAALAASGCEVRTDPLTRQLYATDASIYRIEPWGVAFPRDPVETAAIIRAAADLGIPVIPRGAGSGLGGGAIGAGLILDLARHQRRISNLDLERRTVRVSAGVVLDQLNAFLKPHGLAFGPDVATSSRATMGGMIANDSSGARAPCYGTTAAHVAALELVLADGSVVETGAEPDRLDPLRSRAAELIQAHAAEITARMPPGLVKRWPGYGLSRWLEEPGNLNHLLAGSEGTLAAIVSAEVRLVPLPREKGLGLIFFASVDEAMQATVELLDLEPVAIEHVDRVLFDQTRGQIAFQAARDLLALDSEPCEAFLIVEFYDAVAERLSALAARKLGLRTVLVRRPEEMDLVWALRKAGLSLLTGCPGPAKPVTGIEDVAIRPERLPEYVAALRALLDPLGVAACFYGHAAAGLLHVRPVLDLRRAEDLRKFRQICDEVAALVRQFQGSLAAEHGVGIARTEYLRDQVGEALLGVMREVKASFDPGNLFNPGKIIAADGRRNGYAIDRDLRYGEGYSLELPFTPVLAFAAKDHSFTANLDQCNGCGACRKHSPTMCPTFVATGEELMSTRGRANAIRAVLEGRAFPASDGLAAAELDAALSNCLSCKACAAECPSNVNLPLLKAELLHAKHARHGLPMSARVISAEDLLGRLGCWLPRLANAALQNQIVRRAMASTLGIESRRTLPPYAAERFDRWFTRRLAGKAPDQPGTATPPGSRGTVVLWDDTFVRYHDPHIGRAAVQVLEAAGYAVLLPRGRKCCGRPAFSQGNLAPVGAWGRHNLALLDAPPYADLPVIFLEPSCWAMFRDEYRELRLGGSAAVAERCILFEEFLDQLLTSEPEALSFERAPGHVAIHAHCHAKALAQPEFMARLARRVPGSQVTLLDSGCCGMAGAFGAMAAKYDLSLQVAQPLLDLIRQQPPGTTIVASGTSCRHQIQDLSTTRPRHLAEVLAQALSR
ncbi:MAG: FAD-binding protein [Gemmatimonadetes bacterium]|nr:FAD-binding protein [Gemmatimonadota bacterium]